MSFLISSKLKDSSPHHVDVKVGETLPAAVQPDSNHHSNTHPLGNGALLVDAIDLHGNIGTTGIDDPTAIVLLVSI